MSPTIFVVENILARKASSTAIANDRYTAVTVLLRPRLSVIEDGTLESFTSNRKLAAAMSAVKVRERVMYTCVHVSRCVYVKNLLDNWFYLPKHFLASSCIRLGRAFAKVSRKT